MGTLTEEIFSRRLGRQVHAGETVVAPVDYAMSHDGTSPLAIQAFRKVTDRVWDPQRVVLVFDHIQPANTVNAATIHKSIREFREEQGITHLFQEGICHQLMVEKGFARPGAILVGADSHTTTYGAVGCFAAGMGSTDIGVVYATGRTWFRIPETIRIEVSGQLPEGVYPKDLSLHVIRRLGSEGANYMAVEWAGEAVEAMTIDQRMTLTNMAVDFGAKNGVVQPDETTRRYLGDDEVSDLRPIDPRYAQVIEIDGSEVQPQIACPPSIDNVQDLSRVEGLRLDEVFIGSCTNGRLEDLAVVARLLEGRQVHPDTRTLVVPASRDIYLEALRLGYIETFINAGATVMNAGCGPCLGRQHGVLAPGERAMSTSNRNYPGRMGSAEAEIYLASPAVAAASAVAGAIASPAQLPAARELEGARA